MLEAAKINTIADIPNITLVFGDEEMLIEEFRNKLLNILVDDENKKFNTDIFDASNTELMKIIEIARAYPMMSDYRVIVVKNFEKLFSGRASKKIEENSPINKLIDNPPPTTYLIMEAKIDSASGISKGSKNGVLSAAGQKKLSSVKFPFNRFINETAWIEFPRIYESAYPRWIIERVKVHGKTINEKGAELIAARAKRNLRDIASEIDKLMIYADGKNNISLEDVLFVTGYNHDYNVFELQNQIGRKNIGKSIEILNRLLADDRQEMLILSILTRFFVILFKYSELKTKGMNEYSLASALGIYPGQLGDYSIAAEKYALSEVTNALKVLCDTDEMLKSGKGESITTMIMMIDSIINANNKNEAGV
jgi:DNA polymerase-3 subunit delta